MFYAISIFVNFLSRNAMSWIKMDMGTLVGQPFGQQIAGSIGQRWTRRNNSPPNADRSWYGNIATEENGVASPKDVSAAKSIGELSWKTGKCSIVEPHMTYIKVEGEDGTSVHLSDFRKQLMTVGLFPPELYQIGESFEEIRTRYAKIKRYCPQISRFSKRRLFPCFTL